MRVFHLLLPSDQRLPLVVDLMLCSATGVRYVRRQEEEDGDRVLPGLVASRCPSPSLSPLWSRITGRSQPLKRGTDLVLTRHFLSSCSGPLPHHLLSAISILSHIIIYFPDGLIAAL